LDGGLPALFPSLPFPSTHPSPFTLPSTLPSSLPLQGPFNKEFRELLINRDFYGDCIKLNIPVTKNIQVGRE
jgi:hypothetical protein